jgi:hypothetical protein
MRPIDGEIFLHQSVGAQFPKKCEETCQRTMSVDRSLPPIAPTLAVKCIQTTVVENIFSTDESALIKGVKISLGAQLLAVS